MTNCCYNCKDREIGCHGRCDSYKQYTEALAAHKQLDIRTDKAAQVKRPTGPCSKLFNTHRK